MTDKPKVLNTYEMEVYKKEELNIFVDQTEVIQKKYNAFPEEVDHLNIEKAKSLRDEAHDTIKDIETTRELLKKPYLETWRAIDSRGKELKEPLEKIKKWMKDKIKNYENEVQRKKEEFEKELDGYISDIQTIQTRQWCEDFWNNLDKKYQKKKVHEAIVERKKKLIEEEFQREAKKKQEEIDRKQKIEQERLDEQKRQQDEAQKKIDADRAELDKQRREEQKRQDKIKQDQIDKENQEKEENRRKEEKKIQELKDKKIWEFLSKNKVTKELIESKQYILNWTEGKYNLYKKIDELIIN